MAVRGDSTIIGKTGQVQSYAARDDGDLQRGIAGPDPRFTDNTDGTVTDNLTDLVWLKNANCADATMDWQNAFPLITELNTAGTMYGNSCGDSSNSGGFQTDWRLPNRKELFTLIDRSQAFPAWPSDNPFLNLYDVYWSSTSSASDPALAYISTLGYRGGGNAAPKYGGYDAGNGAVWAVRGGDAASSQPVNGLCGVDHGQVPAALAPECELSE